jgi:hypothetical protein
MKRSQAPAPVSSTNMRFNGPVVLRGLVVGRRHRRHNDKRVPDEGLETLTAYAFARDFSYRRVITVGPGPVANSAPPERRSSVVVLRVAVVILVVVARSETGFDDIERSSFVKEVVFRVESMRKVRVEWSTFAVLSDNYRRPKGRHQIVYLFFCYRLCTQ